MRIGRIVFIGTATVDPARIQRPRTQDEVNAIKENNKKCEIHLVDPEYELTMMTLDKDLRTLDGIKVFPCIASTYFVEHPINARERLVIYDCSGSQTRYDLIERHGLSVEFLPQIGYIPVGCHGEYKFQADIINIDNPPFNPKLSSGGPITIYKRGRRCSKLALEEKRAFCQDIYITIAFIRAKYYSAQPPKWTEFQNIVPVEQLENTVASLCMWYHTNFNDYDENHLNPVDKKLDNIRKVVQKWSLEVMY